MTVMRARTQTEHGPTPPCDGRAGKDAGTSLEELAELAAAALQAPLAFISLLDGNGDWLKSSHGIGATTIPNHDAWCVLALQSDKLLEIPDLRQDARLGSEAAPVSMRFLVAKPLWRPDGAALGVLTVLDDAPRWLDAAERRNLDLVANQIVARLVAEHNDADSRRRDVSEQEAQDMRSFVDIVSHDLRAPLVNVLGFTDELQRSAEELRAIVGQHKRHCPPGLARQLEAVLEEHINPSLGYIRSSAARMDEQVRALLELARAERQVLHRSDVDLGDLLRDVVRSHEIELQRADATVDIGPLATIETDGTVLHHVFENLIDNAVKFRCEQRALRIVVSMDAEERGVVVHISDTGRGIEPRDLAGIFDMFRRVGPDDRPGAGVGLCHTRALVRKLGGRIWCDSVPGEGSTFHVDLPRRMIGPTHPDGALDAAFKRAVGD